MNKCKMCEGDFAPQDGHEADNICESCFHDEFDALDLEDKMAVLLK